MPTRKVISYSLLLIPFTLLFLSCSPSVKEKSTASAYVVDVMLKHTPVKDQGKMQSCWIYAYLACLETERIEQYGDSMNLSALWLERACLQQQAEERYLSQGRRKISIRNVGPEAEYLLCKYGMVPYTHFSSSEGLNSNVVERSLTNVVNIAIRAKKGILRLSDDVDAQLPTPSHSVETGFYLYSMRYTPGQFGRSLYSGADFEWFTSYTHHPFGESFALEVSDNRSHREMMNVPVDSLMRMTVNALRNHHAVYWEGTMHDVPCDAVSLTPEGYLTPSCVTAVAKQRQKSYESFLTTDDHAMAIIGIAHDRQNHRYFICKNSWGKQWGASGFYYMPFEQFAINAMIVGVCQGS